MERLPSSAGISPLNSLPLRFRNIRLERLPSSGGISPLKPLYLRLSFVTRPSLVMTPFHPRNSDGNPDSPQVVVFLETIIDVSVGL